MRSFFVPDLTPRDRPELKGVRFRYIFVAESPHTSEIEPLTELERRPLCGAAGKAWWSALNEILEGEPNDDLSLHHFINFCKKHHIAIMNAVQVPLDVKIAKHFAAAHPMKTLGFSKEAGPHHYKKKSKKLQSKLGDLRERIMDPGLEGALLISLGNDADWFVKEALPKEEMAARYAGKIAHPSAWWRRGGYFRRVSLERMKALLATD